MRAATDASATAPEDVPELAATAAGPPVSGSPAVAAGTIPTIRPAGGLVTTEAL